MEATPHCSSSSSSSAVDLVAGTSAWRVIPVARTAAVLTCRLVYVASWLLFHILSEVLIALRSMGVVMLDMWREQRKQKQLQRKDRRLAAEKDETPLPGQPEQPGQPGAAAAGEGVSSDVARPADRQAAMVTDSSRGGGDDEEGEEEEEEGEDEAEEDGEENEDEEDGAAQKEAKEEADKEEAEGRGRAAEDEQVSGRDVVEPRSTEESQEDDDVPATEDAEPAKEEDDDEGRAGGSDVIMSLRLIRLPGGSADAGCRDALRQAVDEVRRRHRGVRFSAVQEEAIPLLRDFNRVAVLGPASALPAACAALRRAAAATGTEEHHMEDPAGGEEEAEEEVQHFFALQFTMRESWDLPQDDELVDASIEDDWVDLGPGGAGGEVQASSAGGGVAREEDRPSAAAADAGLLRRRRDSLEALLRGRLGEVLRGVPDLHLFMDENPLAAWGGDAVRVDLLGALSPEAWRAAKEAVLACEAHRAYLSRRYDAVFFSPAPLKPQLEAQVESAVSHWKGERANLAGGVGVSGTGFTGFEDLAANVGAVLRGQEPPGWHRLEWTASGAGAVPMMTY